MFCAVARPGTRRSISSPARDFVHTIRPVRSTGSPASRISWSTPHWRYISIVRALMPRALGRMAVPGCRSARSERMPCWDRRIDAVRPTGPPPTMRTGTSITGRRCRRDAADRRTSVRVAQRSAARRRGCRPGRIVAGAGGRGHSGRAAKATRRGRPVPARLRWYPSTPAGQAGVATGAGADSRSSSSQGPGKRPFLPDSENGCSWFHWLRGSS